MLLALAAVTIGGAMALDSSAKHAAEAEAREHLENVATALGRRVDAYDEVLFGLRGAYVVSLQAGDSETLDHSGFERYMRSLDIERRFPGAQVVGIAPLVERDQLDEYTENIIRSVAEGESEYPEFSVYPDTGDNELLPISFVFPIAGNENAVGLDFRSEENRRGATERARDSGAPSATAPVTLVQETGTQHAFLVMVPVYEGGVTPETLEARRDAFVGVVYAAFRMGDLVHGVIDLRSGDELEIVSLPQTTPTGIASDDSDRSNVIFTTADAASRPLANESELLVIDVDGQRWGLVATRKVNGPDVAALLPYAILVGGLGLIALMSATMSARLLAERANRAKSEFLSRMSHELRTPLNAVLGFTQLMQIDDLDETQRANLDQIEFAGEHLLTLVNDVLEISRIEAGVDEAELRPVDLRAAAEGVVELLQTAAADNDVHLTIDHDALAHLALGHDRRVRQALLNLCSNAIKYNRRGGSVVVRLSSTTTGNVRCAVRDTGAGISPDRQARLFQPFDRLDAEHTDVDGIGLGLVLTKRLIEEMRGRVGVRSTPGQGSTFWFELSAGPEHPVEPELSAGPEHSVESGNRALASSGPAVRLGSRTALHIDDRPANQLIIEHVLAPLEDLELLSAADAVAARKLVTSRRIDLVIVAPDLDGVRTEPLIAELRRIAEAPFVLLLQGPDDEHHRRICQTIGAAGLISLPMNLERLRSVVAGQLPAPAQH